jgi:hypothetical protein
MFEQGAQVGKHRVGLLVDVEPGVPPELVAAGAGLALTLVVLLPGVTAVVIAVAAELDGEVVLGPAAVDVSTIDSPIHFRLRKGGGPENVKEAALQSAEGDGNLAPDHPPEVRCAGPVMAAAQDLLDLLGGRVVPDVRLVDRAGEFVLLEDGSEVDERALDGGDRDAAPPGGIGEIRSARPVSDHALDPALGWGKNFGQ